MAKGLTAAASEIGIGFQCSHAGCCVETEFYNTITDNQAVAREFVILAKLPYEKAFNRLGEMDALETVLLREWASRLPEGTALPNDISIVAL